MKNKIMGDRGKKREIKGREKENRKTKGRNQVEKGLEKNCSLKKLLY